MTRPPDRSSWTHWGDDPGPRCFTSKFIALTALTVRLVADAHRHGWAGGPRARFLAVCDRYQAGKTLHVPAESFSQRCADIAVERGLIPALGVLAWGSTLHLFGRFERGGW